MKLPRLHQLWALLCLCLYFEIVVGGVIRRDDAPATTSSPEVSPSTTGKEQQPTSEPTSTLTSLVSTPVTTTTSATVSTSDAPESTGLLNSTLLNNVTIPDGELPYVPVVTPAWGVAGVILLTTGLVYALVGIKTQWVYTFFSTAYLSALGTTVLIVYVAPLPVSNGVQGGLLVAAVCTGVLFGGIAVVFKDVTECMGCLLGGFCFSMWLLTIQPGGLLPETGPKAAFIAAFTLAAFALYFSHWTRSYGQIVCGSFAGATAVVLGLDCFSRAGLKEFWAYVWGLNENIFPLGTVTYPLTKGIRVELAVTIIIFVGGIVSQLRVWRIIQEHRAKKDAIRAEEEQKKEDEDEHIGRQVVQANARELRQWERVYGNGPQSPLSADSGVGEMGNEKRKRNSDGSASIPLPSGGENPGQNGAEPAELPAESEIQSPPPPPPKPTAAEMVISQDAKDGVVTVRVAQDDVPNGRVYDSIPGGIENHKSWKQGESDGESKPAFDSAYGSKVTLPPPSVTPLPFRVPDSPPSDDNNEDDRSSVATFADENNEEPANAHGEARQSLAKKVSNGPAEPLRRLSTHSKGSKVNTVVDMANEPAPSREELAEYRQSYNEDNDSITANLDDLSSNGDADTAADDNEAAGAEATADAESKVEDKEEASEAAKMVGSAASKTETTTVAPSDSGSAMESAGKSTRGPKSTVSMDSTQASLTQTNLPRPLSRIALSYRTNEWAKHLSVADTPAPEGLDLREYPEETREAVATDKEVPAPLNVVELQQTAENAAPPPAVPRSTSAMSNYAALQMLGKKASSTSALPQQQYQPGSTPSPEPPLRSANASGPPLTHQNKAFRSKSSTLTRRASGIHAQPIVEEAANETRSMRSAAGDGASSRSGSMPPSPTVPDAPPSASRASMRSPVPGVVSYSSPQTLLGQREMYLRNKSHTSFVLPAADPHAASMAALAPIPSEYAGSMYNQPAYAAPVDMDDLPMSQRRDMMRRVSLGSGSDPVSGMALHGAAMASAPAFVFAPTPADQAAFNSHQPQRENSAKSADVREAQLREFRNSVAADLRAGTPQAQAFGATDRSALAKRTSLMGFATGQGDAAVLQGVEKSRSALIGQKEAESQARETARLEREKNETMFEQRMRADASFQEAHREAMRKLQNRARE